MGDHLSLHIHGLLALNHSPLILNLPRSPRNGNTQLHHAPNPQRSAQPRPTATEPAPGYRARQHQHGSSSAPVPLRVLGPGREQGRIAEQIAVQAREHVGGHLVEAQLPAGDDLAPEPKREQGHDGEGARIPLLGARHGLGGLQRPERGRGPALRQRRRREDQERLGAEVAGEGPLGGGALRRSCGLAEDEDAEDEGADRAEGAQPEEGHVGGEAGGAEREEHRVAGLHRDEDRGRVERDAVAEARDQTA